MTIRQLTVFLAIVSLPARVLAQLDIGVGLQTGSAFYLQNTRQQNLSDQSYLGLNVSVGYDPGDKRIFPSFNFSVANLFLPAINTTGYDLKFQFTQQLYLVHLNRKYEDLNGTFIFSAGLGIANLYVDNISFSNAQGYNPGQNPAQGLGWTDSTGINLYPVVDGRITYLRRISQQSPRWYAGFTASLEFIYVYNRETKYYYRVAGNTGTTDLVPVTLPNQVIIPGLSVSLHYLFVKKEGFYY